MFALEFTEKGQKRFLANDIVLDKIKFRCFVSKDLPVMFFREMTRKLQKKVNLDAQIAESRCFYPKNASYRVMSHLLCP